jgi:hypothetical protein
MRFVPAGRTDDPKLPMATSVTDYVARRLAVDSLPQDRRRERGIYTSVERSVLASFAARAAHNGGGQRVHSGVVDCRMVAQRVGDVR